MWFSWLCNCTVSLEDTKPRACLANTDLGVCPPVPLLNLNPGHGFTAWAELNPAQSRVLGEERVAALLPAEENGRWEMHRDRVFLAYVWKNTKPWIQNCHWESRFYPNIRKLQHILRPDASLEGVLLLLLLSFKLFSLISFLGFWDIHCGENVLNWDSGDLHAPAKWLRDLKKNSPHFWTSVFQSVKWEGGEPSPL